MTDILDFEPIINAVYTGRTVRLGDTNCYIRQASSGELLVNEQSIKSQDISLKQLLRYTVPDVQYIQIELAELQEQAYNKGNENSGLLVLDNYIITSSVLMIPLYRYNNKELLVFITSAITARLTYITEDLYIYNTGYTGKTLAGQQIEASTALNNRNSTYINVDKALSLFGACEQDFIPGIILADDKGSLIALWKPSKARRNSKVFFDFTNIEQIGMFFLTNQLDTLFLENINLSRYNTVKLCDRLRVICTDTSEDISAVLDFRNNVTIPLHLFGELHMSLVAIITIGQFNNRDIQAGLLDLLSGYHISLLIVSNRNQKISLIDLTNIKGIEILGGIHESAKEYTCTLRVYNVDNLLLLHSKAPKGVEVFEQVTLVKSSNSYILPHTIRRKLSDIIQVEE